MSERKVPKIRFPGFTDDWEQRKLGDYVDIVSGDAPSKFEDGNELYVKVDDLNYNLKYVTDSQSKVAIHKSIKKALKGSVVFPKRGAAIMTNKVRILAEDSYMDTNMMALSSDRIDSEFLYNVISKEGLYKIADTSTIPQINNKHIEPYEVMLPNMEEQKRIGEFFENMDNLITLHQRELDKWKELKKGMLQKMFPKDGESVPEIRFPGFEGQWKRYKLEEVTDEFRSGTFIAATDIGDDGEYPVYGGNGLRGYANTFNHDGEFALIGRQGALCGNVNYSYGKAYFTEHAVAVKANSSANTKFLFYLLDLMRLGQYSDQSAQPGLAVGKLIKLENMFPSKQEQKRISNLFSLLDMIISNLQGEVMKWQSLKKALLQQMFVQTGTG